MTATKMKVDIIPPYTSDTFNTYWEIITPNGKVIDRGNAASDSAAALAGVPVYGLYRNGNAVQIRLT